ncbi:metallophosphoesterase [Oleiphilus messinensis]|uniref:Metallophosphoesterase n=1 Tax=Oleiphilus messinensis TaxID=141451 RepID=A0A1Y0I8F7_9GAMM|nr:metallophosphoesterase [Oleiphilus messinensis]ARU56751.1 metallophosphoesterase [Oleiphilus messinensis]
MKSLLALSIAAATANIAMAAPNFIVKPYLQNPDTDAMSVYVETLDTNVTLHYRERGNTTFSTLSMEAIKPLSGIKRARIEGLSSDTRYEYYVSTSFGQSDTWGFKTWPETANGRDSFKIVAFSDSQGQHAERLADIVTSGIIVNDCGNDVENCDDEIAAVIVPGDLVQNGGNVSEWRNDFFGKAADLFSRVPVIPAIGNHDYSVSHYLNYFELPENGSVSYKEHWYVFDYLNLRLVTLNSNSPQNAGLNVEQREWLDNLLADTANRDETDYVMLQLHHPCKSEMWLPGESQLTCEYVKKFEDLSAQTGKITGHIFGHTHAYSRGQSRDVSHLWLNAAVSSGNIDYWDEYPQFDYDEFQKSYPEYGYSSLVFGVDKQRLAVKRYSGGDGKGNYFGYQGEGIRDDFEIAGDNVAPDTPFTQYPKNETVKGVFKLKASSFVDGDNDAHLEAHWQISSTPDFSEPELDFWGNKTRNENIWKYVDTQMGVPLDSYEVTTLLPSGNYFWRVRYRDEHWAWSAWSDSAGFNVQGLTYSDNLVQNGGAEQGLEHWTVDTGVVEANLSNECNGVPAQSGERYFVLGGLCEHSDVGQASQSISLSEFQSEIADGDAVIEVSAFLRDWSGNDIPEAWVEVYDTGNQLIGTSDVITNASSSWLQKKATLALPTNAAFATVRLKGTRNNGTDNDSYIDNVSVRIAYQEGTPAGGHTTENLIQNPGAESELQHWTVETGIVEALESGACSGVSPHEGSRYFILGGLCSSSAIGQASQTIDLDSVSGYNAGTPATVNFSAYMRDWNGNDVPEAWLQFLNSNGEVISQSSTLSHRANNWSKESLEQPLPSGTTSIKVVMKGTRNAGSDNDSYIDTLELTLTTGEAVVGDLDGNGQLDASDRNQLRAALGQCEGDSAFLASADLDADQCISMQDYRAWLRLYKNQ